MSKQQDLFSRVRSKDVERNLGDITRRIDSLNVPALKSWIFQEGFQELSDTERTDLIQSVLHSPKALYLKSFSLRVFDLSRAQCDVLDSRATHILFTHFRSWPEVKFIIPLSVTQGFSRSGESVALRDGFLGEKFW